MKKINSDLWGGVIMLLIALLFWTQMDEDFTRYAAYFPERLIPILVFLGVLLLIKAKVRPTMMDAWYGKINSTMLFAMVTGLVWVVSMEWIGFIISSFVAIFAMLVRFAPADKRSAPQIAKYAGIAALEVGAIYVLFVELLYVTMPTGRLFYS